MKQDTLKLDIQDLIKNKDIGRKKKPTTSITHTNTPELGGTVVHGNNTIINQQPPAQNYKFDDSAAKAGREIIGYRSIGEQVDPQNMTRKEYEHYLCWKFNFKIGKGWDGIERHHHNPNWSEEPLHNIESLDKALDFLGIKANFKAPDGLEKRSIDRRSNQRDIRKLKTERRLPKKGRRKEDITNNIVYYTIISILIIICIMWVAASIYYLLGGFNV